GHHDDAGGEFRQFGQDPLLVSVRRSQDGVQGRDYRHPQVPQKAKDVAAGRASEDAELVLQAEDIRVAEVQEVCRPHVRVEVLLIDLESHLWRIVVSIQNVIDRYHEGIGGWIPAGQRRMQIASERGDTAFSGRVIAEEADLAYLKVALHMVPG